MNAKRKQFRRLPTSQGHRRGRKGQHVRRLGLETLEDRRLMAVDATFGLERPVIIGSVANFGVTIDYSASDGEALAFFSLDTAPSSPSLIGPGSDFSAFSFTPATPLLDDWTQIGAFNDAGFESTVEFDDSLIAPLQSGTYTLGTLSVDFGAAGVDFGDVFTVSIEGFHSVIGVEDPVNGFRFEPVNFSTGSRTVVPVTISGPASVAEGSSYPLTLEVLGNTSLDLVIDWGDGTEESISSADLPPSGEISHPYIDGDTTPSILVDVLRSNGSRAAAGQLEVAVHNVAPTVALNGQPTANEGEPYSLTIGDVTDPGDDTVSAYIVHWGDNQHTTIPAAGLPADGKVLHTYTDGVSSAHIVVDLVDDDGTHENAGSVDVLVNNISPTVALSGDSHVDEGSPYALTIGGVTDPGNDTVSQYVIHWGDETQDVINTADLPANGQVVHTYADGLVSLEITVDLVDEDGVHSAGSLAVDVNNVAPSILLSGPDTIAEGTPYTLTLGAITEPGEDTVAQYFIHWGDDQDTIIDSNDFPSNGEIVHTFADGPRTPTIEVDLVDEDGTHLVAGSLPIAVTNVGPTIVLSGDANIDEGSSYLLTISDVTDPGTDTVTQYIIDWGDGEEEIVNAANLPPTRQVTHSYSDGPGTASIAVSLVDEDGSYETVDSLAIAVNNVSPTLVLTGEGNVSEGSLYTLTLGDVTDPGDDTVTEYVVDWGDGHRDIIPASELGANRQLTHNFSDGPSSVDIFVELVDDDGTHLAAGTLSVDVDNVPPTASISGASSVAEGSVYTLTIGPVSDPGDDTVAEYLIDWGDGQHTSVSADSLPTSGEVSHTYADGPSTAAITVELVDEDGTHSATGAFNVDINNVAPIVTLTGSATVPEGSLYTLTIGPVIDPGTDVVTQYVIDWGDGQQTTINAADLPANRQVTHAYADNQTPTISVNLIDEDGSYTAAGTLSITVTNVEPSVVSVINTSSDCGGVLEGHSMSVSLNFSDPGISGENFNATIDWGDGTQSPASQITFTSTPGSPGVPTQGTVSASHIYPDGGIYRITIKVSDDDGAFTTASTTAMISGAGLNQGILHLVGTNDPDHVTINQQGNGIYKFHVDFFETGNFKTFPTEGVQLINVTLCGGEDHFTLSGSITTRSIVDGGTGVDHLNVGTPNHNAYVVDDGELPTNQNVDLGIVDFSSVPNLNLNLASANRSFTFEAMRTGTLTLEAAFTASQGGAQLVLLDQDLNVLSSSSPVATGQRLDGNAVAGEKFRVFVLGNNSDVDLTIVNMITQNSPLAVHGTAGDDRFEFISGEVLRLRVNGIDYQYDPAKVTSITFLGNGGSDGIVLAVASVDEVVSLLEQAADLAGENYAAFVRSMESIEVRGIDIGPLLQNTVMASDVNGDGLVAPMDALAIINRLTTFGPQSVVDALTSVAPGTEMWQYDVNGDGNITPIDALVVINALQQAHTSNLGGEGEGDSLDTDFTSGDVASPVLSAEDVSGAELNLDAIPYIARDRDLDTRSTELTDSAFTPPADLLSNELALPLPTPGLIPTDAHSAFFALLDRDEDDAECEGQDDDRLI